MTEAENVKLGEVIDALRVAFVLIHTKPCNDEHARLEAKQRLLYAQNELLTMRLGEMHR